MRFVRFRRAIEAASRFGAVLALGGLASAPAVAGEVTGSAPPALDAGPAAAPDSGPDLDPSFYDAQWSLGLRGAYISDSSSGTRYQQLILPSVSVSHTGSRFSYHGAADGQLSKTDGNAVNIDAARLSAGAALAFDPDTSVSGTASLSRTQEDVNSPDVASDVAATPVETSGAADVTFARKFGRFNLALTGTAERDIYGATTLTDGTSVDNTSQNNTSVGGSARLGFQLTPIVEVFTKAGATRTVFDALSPTLTAKLDGTLYTAMTGASAKWEDWLQGTVSAGVGLEHFDDASLGDVRATLYDASLTYKPTSTLTLDGDFTTTVGAPGPDGAGTAQIQYAATAGATYLVNDWLDWRASAGWHDTSYAQSTVTDRGYSLGVGADYVLSRHSKLSADYLFEHAEVSPSAPDDTHTVTLGVTFQK